MFNQNQIDQFNNQGFIIERKLASEEVCRKMLGVARESIDPPLAPVEFETDVQYPGSPADRLSPGGDTPRRLLHAFTRDAVFREWATSKIVSDRVKLLLQTAEIDLSQNHHNCIMTKHTGYSSATLWHQDIRFWLFDQPDLVSVWLALGDEYADNGGMKMIPGSHLEDLDRGRYDGAFFLRQDLPENQSLIETAVSADLSRGDVLFFHSGTLHAAGRNNTSQVKISVVFTYHDHNNQPLAGTRSASYPDISC
jgi:phytanoyl-CoA hydroxylase